MKHVRLCGFPLAMLLAAASVAFPASPAAPGAGNLVANGSFEQVEGGAPVDWSATGDGAVRQELSADSPGKVGRHAAKLHCSAFDRRGPSSHAMLAQVGKIALTKGTLYRFSCWMRAEGLRSRHVSVAISDTARWSNCGLQASFLLGRAWRRCEAYFTATKTVSQSTRLQFWYGETGTLWVDDVQIAPVGKLELAFTDRIEPGESRNLLPNASFECGPDGWASLGKQAGWGNLSGLYGTIQAGGAHDGEHCLRIELGPGKTPVTYFDYFDPVAVVQHAPLAANVGWVRVRKGKSYTLSAWMRADRDGVPGKLLVCLSDPGGWPNPHSKEVVLSQKWQRHTLTFQPWRGWLFVAVGPDLSGSRDPSATVWIDAVQLEESQAPTEFVPRAPVEVGLETGRFGNVFSVGEPVKLVVRGAGRADQPSQLQITAAATDYFGKDSPLGELRLAAPANGSARKEWPLPLTAPGQYAVRVAWRVGDRSHVRRLPVAIVQRYPHKDSPFGINHAPPTAELCRLLRDAGVVWARDWSLKWQHVEPQPGRFDPAVADVQIDRVLATGMRQMCLLPPFPSSNWASAAPKSLDTKGYPGVRLAMAYAPKDPRLLEQFIERCVKHCKGRVKVWEFLNEPIYTDYALPAGSKGVPGAAYTVGDYVRLLKIAAAAMKRADPDCLVMGGIGGGPDLLTREFIEAGGLEAINILNLHTYPSKAPPEGFLEPMGRLNERMRQAGRVRPIWITEYSYYAADRKPWEPYVPQSGNWAGNRLLDDEKQCADYSVRFAAVMLASGAEKVFYHSGSSGEVNRPSLECCLVGYAGVPRKAYAAQAAMANALGPSPRFASRLAPPGNAEGVYACAFQCGRRAVLIAWADTEIAAEGWTLRAPDTARLADVVGRGLPAGPALLGPSPVYAISEALSAGDLAKSCTLAAPGK